MKQDVLEVFCYFIMRIFNVKNKICQQDIIFFYLSRVMLFSICNIWIRKALY